MRLETTVLLVGQQQESCFSEAALESSGQSLLLTYHDLLNLRPRFPGNQNTM
jgi:hypothetical protein